MTIEHLEHQAAQVVHRCALELAESYCQPQDKAETAVAILMHALELATPELSPERRASLFNMEE